MMIHVLEVDYHRNGVGGEGFDVVPFVHNDRRMVGVVFEGWGQCAVLDIDALGLGWRGDVYEPELRHAIELADADGSRFDHPSRVFP